MWELGVAFRGKENYCKGEKDFYDTEHVMILVSNPFIQDDEEVVIVAAIMSYNGMSRNQDQSCILTTVDGNPPIRHNSYICYKDNHPIPIKTLDNMLKSGKIYLVNSIKDTSKIKLLEGLSNSEFVYPSLNFEAENQLEKYRNLNN